VSGSPAFERFGALGTGVVVGTAEARLLPAAVAAARCEIEACDLACSRFRPDGELVGLRPAGRPTAVSEWLAEALDVALRAAEVTEGLVDPTVGQCLVDLGYDRTFTRVDLNSPIAVTASHRPAWRSIHLDRQNRRVTVPAGVRIDLGATAKALCSDRAATRAAEATGTGVLVSLGGDIAVCGEPPPDGWVIRVTDRSDCDPADASPGQTVAVRAGGLATSGTSVRRWSRAGRTVHHLVDPRTGRPADEIWRTVSVAAGSCVAANTASTAAMILGAAAPGWLIRQGHDARLVPADGPVTVVGGWPAETEGPVAA
jgi:thiamine biosynthesis lipoprotein